MIFIFLFPTYFTLFNRKPTNQYVQKSFQTLIDNFSGSIWNSINLNALILYMKWHQKESGSLLKEKSRYKHTHTHTLSSVRLHTHTHTYTHTLSSTPQWEPGRVWLLHLLESHLLQWRWPGCSIYVEWFVLRQNENSLKRKKIPKEMKKNKIWL